MYVFTPSHILVHAYGIFLSHAWQMNGRLLVETWKLQAITTLYTTESHIHREYVSYCKYTKPSKKGDQIAIHIHGILKTCQSNNVGKNPALSHENDEGFAIFCTYTAKHKQVLKLSGLYVLGFYGLRGIILIRQSQRCKQALA